jgi:hypothetical protein
MNHELAPAESGGSSLRAVASLPAGHLSDPSGSAADAVMLRFLRRFFLAVSRRSHFARRSKFKDNEQ